MYVLPKRTFDRFTALENEANSENEANTHLFSKKLYKIAWRIVFKFNAFI